LEWFWDLSRVTSSNYTKSNTKPVIYYQQVNLKDNTREGELLRELIGKLDFDMLTVDKAFALISPILALNMCGAWKIQQSRMQENPSQFCSKRWKQKHDIELRERNIQYFLNRMNQWAWNENKKIEDSPVLPVVHGTSEAIAWKIASGGFATLSTLDSGFYGKGIYFFIKCFLYTSIYNKQKRSYNSHLFDNSWKSLSIDRRSKRTSFLSWKTNIAWVPVQLYCSEEKWFSLYLRKL